MKTKWKSHIKWVGWILAVVGLIDIPEQLQKWIKFFQSLTAENVDWSSPLLGEALRTGITFVGIGLLLFAYEVPQRLSRLIRRPQRQSSPFHIEFGQSGSAHKREEIEYNQAGLELGRRNIWYLLIQNVEPRTISGVEASIVRIEPNPMQTVSGDQLVHRSLPFPQRLKFGNECSASQIILRPGEPMQLLYVSYYDSALTPKRIRLEGSNLEFYPDEDEEYSFYIRITGDNVPPASMEIGVTRHGDSITVACLHES